MAIKRRTLLEYIKEDSQRVLDDVRDTDAILGQHLSGIKPLAANLQSKADAAVSGTIGKPQPMIAAANTFKQKMAMYASELKKLYRMMEYEDFWSSNMGSKVEWLKMHYATLIHQLDSMQKLIQPIENAGAETITGSGGSLMSLVQGTAALAQTIVNKLQECREGLSSVVEQLKEDPTAAEKAMT